MGIIVGRHIEEITLNPLEYILDDNNEIMIFNSIKNAKEFLKKHGFTDEEISYFTFENINMKGEVV